MVCLPLLFQKPLILSPCPSFLSFYDIYKILHKSSCKRKEVKDKCFRLVNIPIILYYKNNYYYIIHTHARDFSSWIPPLLSSHYPNPFASVMPLSSGHLVLNVFVSFLKLVFRWSGGMVGLNHYVSCLSPSLCTELCLPVVEKTNTYDIHCADVL